MNVHSLAEPCKHSAPDGASHVAGSRGYKHSAPTELSCQLHVVLRLHGAMALTRLILIGISVLSAGFYSDAWVVSAQKRRTARPQRTLPARIDYSRFLHSTKQHQEACSSCHKAPTSNWTKARGFPDVADYPDHDACVRCHRPQFFKGAQPAICTNCHTKVSPRDEVRFAFRNPARPRQFKIEFPHNKHQDVVAYLQRGPGLIARGQFARASSIAFAHAAQTRTDYNNCTICHQSRLRSPDGPTINTWASVPGAFKTVPDSHSACFNCHWKSQQPTKDNCAGCHKLAAPYVPDTTPNRISMKFRHEGGGDKQIHLAECTTCHINITKAASLSGLKPDVPITGCTECHNKSGLREDLGTELAAIDKDKDFVCSYCHTPDIGKRDPPAEHYLVAERVPLKRKDIK